MNEIARWWINSLCARVVDSRMWSGNSSCCDISNQSMLEWLERNSLEDIVVMRVMSDFQKRKITKANKCSDSQLPNGMKIGMRTYFRDHMTQTPENCLSPPLGLSIACSSLQEPLLSAVCMHAPSPLRAAMHSCCTGPGTNMVPFCLSHNDDMAISSKTTPYL